MKFNKRIGILVAFMLLALSFSVVPAPATTWQITSVGSALSPTYHTVSLALEPNGTKMGLAFIGANYYLYYVPGSAGTWGPAQTVASGSIDLSLALDSIGNPHISYFDATQDHLDYAYFSSAWYTQTVDNGTDTGLYSSLALDSIGNPHISYIDSANSRLMYASWAGGAWATQTVTSGGGSWTSLAFDINGNPHISFCGSDGHLYYASWTGTSWTTVDASANMCLYSSLAFSSTNGYPAISYYDATNHNLKLANYTGTTWTIQTVDSPASTDVGQYSSLAFDSIGNPGMGYYDYTNQYLKYAYWTGSTWSIETVSSGGASASLAFDASGSPHIGFFASGSAECAIGSAFERHDVAVTNVECSKTVVFQGYTANITVTVANQGDFTETFNVTAYANTTATSTETLTLANQASKTLTFTWNTTSFVYGNYTLSAYAWPVPGETNTANNNFTDGWIFVSMVGDLTGSTPFKPDGKVNIMDISVVAKAFGTTPGMPLWNANCDVNNDGIVNIRDISIVAKNWGATTNYP